MKEIIKRKPIQIKANETLGIDLTEPFRINDSLFSLIHNFKTGSLTVKISNAKGYSITNTFNITPPLVIAFKKSLDSMNKVLDVQDYFYVELTPTENFEGEFSFANEYPEDMVNIHRNH